MASSPATPAHARVLASRLMIYLGFGIALGLVHRLTGHPMSAFLFFAYLFGLLALFVYRQVARLPGLRRVLRPTRLTREGVYFLVLTLVFGAAAVNTGDNLLHLLLSLLLASILASGLLAEAGLSRLQASRRLRGPYFEGVPGQVELAVDNRKLLFPAMSIAVEDRLERGRGRVYLLSVPPRGSASACYPLLPARRGRLALSALRISSRFPFGFFEKERTLPAPGELLVYPRISPLRREWLAGWGLELDPARSAVLAAEQGEDYLGLREYRPGDNPRTIHWRVSARLSKLMVREFVPPDGRRVLLLLDSFLPDPDDAELAGAVDACCRIMASLAYHYFEQGFHVGLLLPGREPLVCRRRSQQDDSLLHLLELLALEQNREVALSQHLERARLPQGFLVPILPRSGAPAAAVLQRLPRRRRSWPIFAEQESQVTDPSQALIPGRQAPIALDGAATALRGVG